MPHVILFDIEFLLQNWEKVKFKTRYVYTFYDIAYYKIAAVWEFWENWGNQYFQNALLDLPTIIHIPPSMNSLHERHINCLIFFSHPKHFHFISKWENDLGKNHLQVNCEQRWIIEWADTTGQTKNSWPKFLQFTFL